MEKKQIQENDLIEQKLAEYKKNHLNNTAEHKKGVVDTTEHQNQVKEALGSGDEDVELSGGCCEIM